MTNQSPIADFSQQHNIMKEGAMDLITTGDITRIEGITGAQMRYALAMSRVKPVARAGIAFLYNRGDLAKIRQEIERIAKKRKD